MRNIRTFIFICSILALLSVSNVVIAQKKQKLSFEPFTVEFDTKYFKEILISGPKAKDLTPFEVENPRRLVLDLPRKIGKFLKESNYVLNNSTCSKSIRIGGHPDKTRLVIDLNSKCDFEISKKPDGLKINFAAQHNLTTAIPTAAPTHTLTPSFTPTSVPIIISTTTPANTPTSTSTATVTITPTVTATASATSTSTPSESNVDTIAIPTVTPTNMMKELLIGKVLEQISFFHDGNINQVKLNFSQRVSFKTVKDAPRKYKISVKDCLIARPGLSLPHFPPNDVVGFTLIQPVKEGPDLNIYVNVEDGIKINASNVDNTIVITSEPAGF